MREKEASSPGLVNPSPMPLVDEAAKWAMEAMRNQQWQEAAQRWAVLQHAYPDEAMVWIQAGICHRQLGNLAMAQNLLESAVERFPGRPAGILELTEVAYANNDTSRVAALLEQARERFPNHMPVLLKSAELEQRLGHPADAERYNVQAREQFADHPQPWVQYAELAMQREEWSLALSRWAEIRQRFPEHPAGYNRAALAAEQAGDVRHARRLRLAREYGQKWLESFDEPSQTEKQALDDKISPPTRRHWLAFIDLIWTKARLNLKSEASQNYLRYLWWVIDPLLYMSVFYLVFGMLLNRGGEGFVAYLLTGLVPFQWFAKTLQQTSNSIVSNKGLMNQVHISPLFFPLVGIVQNSGKQLLVFFMLGIFLVFYGLPPTVHWLAFIPVMLVQLFLMAIFSCTLAMLVPFVRDLTNLIPTGIQFMLFCSGVFYSASIIPEQWRSLFFLNPMANILYQYRLILIEHQWPDWQGLGWVLLGCLLGSVLLFWLYRRVESVLPRVVIE